MEITQTNETALGAYQALNVLQPRNQGHLAESPYDIGINKVSHALVKTYQKIKPVIDPIAEQEGQYQSRKKELRQAVLESKEGTPERAKAQAAEKELDKEFRKHQEDMLEEEVNLIFHQVDLEHWKRGCRTPPFWVLDALAPMWLNASAPKEGFKITRGDAYKLMKAVAEWLKATPAHQLPIAQFQEAIAREDERIRKKDITASERAEAKDRRKKLEESLEEVRGYVFPVDIGMSLAIDLYWNYRSAKEALQDFEDERAERLQRVEAWRKVEASEKTEKGGKPDTAEPTDDSPANDAEDAETLEPLPESEFKEWEDKMLEEVIDVPGITQISYSDIPETVGTPNGIVMDGLLAILKED